MTFPNLSKSFSRSATIPTLAVLLLFSATSPLRAESSNHLVSSQALQNQVQAQSSARQQNIQTVRNFFSTPLAQRAMKMEHVSPSQVTNAIPTLSDSQLASLSSRASQAKQEFSAGELTTDQMLLLIIVLLVVVLLVAVH